MPTGAQGPPAREARDVMAFGHEVGRVLSDGRIVGRAEPFAKVFPSSRAVKRAVGLVAWGILEDIALDARLDDRGRLVAETNVRRIGEHLGLSKTTVHKHLAALRDFGFVLHEELRESDSGRYDTARYVIDPSACIERFTTTPASRTVTAAGRTEHDLDTAPNRPPSDTQQVSDAPGEEPPGPGQHRVPDSGTRSVYQFTGHRDLVQPSIEQRPVVQQQRQRAPARTADHDESRDGGGGDGGQRGLVDALTRAGVAEPTATRLVLETPAQRVREALEVAAGKRLANPAGWLVAAISGGWDLSADLADVRSARARARALDRHDAADEQRRAADHAARERTAAWAAAVSAALDDRQLQDALGRLTRPVPGVERRSVAVACADLARWAQAVAAAHPDRALADALRRALAARPTPADVPEVPPNVEPPAAPRSVAGQGLAERVRALLQRSAQRSADPPGMELSL